MGSFSSASPGKRLDALRQNYESGVNPLSYIPYADALRKQGAFSLALEICQSGLIRDSYSVTGRTLLARILFDAGRYDRALEELGIALQLAPDAFGANLLMAQILTKKREFNDALEILDGLRKQNPNDTEFQELEGFLQSRIYALETSGDFLQDREGAHKPASFDEKVNELLAQLRNYPDVARFNFSRLTDDLQDLKKDPDVAKYLFSFINLQLSQGGLGTLKHMMLQLDYGCLLLYFMENSLLKIELKSDENIGKLRFQIESLMKS